MRAVLHPADLGVLEARRLLAERALSARELTEACLARIRERDGTHSHDGDLGSINAWVRVYEEDALRQADAADRALAAGSRGASDPPPLTGIPFGLKDLYAVAGKPLTASSRLLEEVPDRDADVTARLTGAGMVLLGHLHTHEFALGGTTDQVGNPWALDCTAGGSSGGSSAALAARMVPAATGTDTAGSLRIPSALAGTSTIKPTRGLLSLAGVVPLGTTLDHPGPMARTLADCAVLLAAMAGPDDGRPESALARAHGASLEAAAAAAESPDPHAFEGAKLALSPRIGLAEVEPDVAERFEEAVEVCRRLGATLVEPPPPDVELLVWDDFLDVLMPEFLAYHRRFDGREDLYRPAIREWRGMAIERAVTAERYVAAQERRRALTARVAEWMRAHGLTALLEPTVPVTAWPRGDGYERAGRDAALISLTHYWDWTGLPVVALPSGVGARSGLPCSVSLIGPAASEAELLRLGIALQAELGVPVPPLAA